MLDPTLIAMTGACLLFSLIAMICLLAALREWLHPLAPSKGEALIYGLIFVVSAGIALALWIELQAMG